ncbi:hypothetical protein FRX31_031202 [Thalictrum thalictroides]|uniref:Uncharacterized protein n=1 Tax=Thalictrum thalictroides TaxID=46969 RepID=A0A7J6V4N3_THATH|nr:hypothetical protein FRX31_031202 [Thalictrum thalictroides]
MGMELRKGEEFVMEKSEMRGMVSVMWGGSQERLVYHMLVVYGRVYFLLYSWFLKEFAIRESERIELQHLIDEIGRMGLKEEDDEWEWAWEKNKDFTVKSFYNQLWISKQTDERQLSGSITGHTESGKHLRGGVTVATTEPYWARGMSLVFAALQHHLESVDDQKRGSVSGYNNDNS